MIPPTEYQCFDVKLRFWDRVQLLFGVKLRLAVQAYVRPNGCLVSHIGVYLPGREVGWLHTPPLFTSESQLLRENDVGNADKLNQFGENSDPNTVGW